MAIHRVVVAQRIDGREGYVHVPTSLELDGDVLGAVGGV